MWYTIRSFEFQGKRWAAFETADDMDVFVWDIQTALDRKDEKIDALEKRIKNLEKAIEKNFT